MSLRRLPAGSRTTHLPIGGTVIMLMVPRVFPELRGTTMGVLWTLWVIVWVIVIVDLVLGARAGSISKAKWESVFGKADTDD